MSLSGGKMNDCPFYDIKLIQQVDTRVNFIIKCENQDELEIIQSIINTKAKGVTGENFINKFRENWQRCNIST